MEATMITGDICDNCEHKSSQTLYSAICTYGTNKDKRCLDVGACCEYKEIERI